MIKMPDFDRLYSMISLKFLKLAPICPETDTFKEYIPL